MGVKLNIVLYNCIVQTSGAIYIYIYIYLFSYNWLKFRACLEISRCTVGQVFITSVLCICILFEQDWYEHHIFNIFISTGKLINRYLYISD